LDEACANLILHPVEEERKRGQIVLFPVRLEPDAVRDGVRVALADCEAIFRAQEVNKRMKEKAAHACQALCRARVVEEMHQRRGTRIAEHLKLVLTIIDRQGH
jgi:hypothetical protein